MDTQDVMELIQPYIDKISKAFDTLISTMFKAVFETIFTNDDRDIKKLYSVDIDDQFVLSGNVEGLYMLRDKESGAILFMACAKPAEKLTDQKNSDKTAMKLVFAYLSHAVK